MNINQQNEILRFAANLSALTRLGWVWQRQGWRFEKGGRLYDLSAADLGQLERIEREGLFVVEEAQPQ